MNGLLEQDVKREGSFCQVRLFRNSPGETEENMSQFSQDSRKLGRDSN